MMESHAQWEEVSWHQDEWIEFPARHGDSPQVTSVKVRPSVDEQKLIFAFPAGDNKWSAEVGFADLRRLLICAREQWGYR